MLAVIHTHRYLHNAHMTESQVSDVRIDFSLNVGRRSLVSYIVYLVFV